MARPLLKRNSAFDSALWAHQRTQPFVHPGENTMRMRQLLLAATTIVVPAMALATPANPPGTLPEPETLALIAVAGVAAAIARWRKKK